MRKEIRNSALLATAAGILYIASPSIRTFRAIKKYNNKYNSENTKLTMTEQLKNLEIDGCYHNAGSVDQNPGRLEKGLHSPDITEIELDILAYKGTLVAGHTTASFKEYHKTHPNAVEDQELSRLIASCVEHKKAPHFDVKFSRRDTPSFRHFVSAVEAIPHHTPVKISGRDWKLLESMSQKITRPLTTLFTVDGHFGNTWKNYKKNILSCHRSDPYHKAGTSIKDALITPRIIDELNSRDHHSQAYCVDTPAAAIRFAQMKVSGVTSNNHELLIALGKKSESRPQNAITVFYSKPS